MRPTSPQSGASLRLILYLVCVLTDFSAFVIVFTVSRMLADAHAASWYLGLIGAGLSLSSGISSALGGWLSSRFDSRSVFICGSSGILLSAIACRTVSPTSQFFIPAYWSLGVGLGLLYPPLISWLNQGETPGLSPSGALNRSGVSRRLIAFCIAWNVGMMSGQLIGGAIFTRGIDLAFSLAAGTSLLNLVLGLIALRFVEERRPVSAAEAVSTELRREAVLFKRLGWIANLGGVFGGSMVIHLLPDLMVFIGTPAADHGSLLACWRGVIILTYLVMHGASFWQYRLDVSLASQILGASGLIVIATAQSNFVLMIGLALLGQLVGYNYFSGLFYSTAGSEPGGRAFAAGIHEATLATGMALGTLIGGAAGSVWGHRVPYLMAAVVILFLVSLQTFTWRRWREELFTDRNATPFTEPESQFPNMRSRQA